MDYEWKQETRQRVGMRLAAIRRQSGLTQAEVAERAGITAANVARIEQGRYDVRLDVLQAIADVFGMDVDFVNKQI